MLKLDNLINCSSSPLVYVLLSWLRLALWLIGQVLVEAPSLWVVKFFTKCLAHDETLERCVPLVSQRHTLLSCFLNLLKIQLYYVSNDRLQYSDLEALGCLPYPVVWSSAWSRCHLKNAQYGGLEALGCLPYPVVRPSARSRDHLRT
jgi:hypothetical protein